MSKVIHKTASRDSHNGQFRVEPSLKQLGTEMRSFAGKLKTDKSAARDFLVKAGIVTQKGNLRKSYGG